MTPTVKLLFGVHAHQPAGNFSAVVAEAHERCYRPFLEVLDRHPEFPFAVHVSGWLLEFLAREFQNDVAKLRAMVARGQAEVFGGGDTEPVLAAIPEADRRDQIDALNRRIMRRLGVAPRGAWLAERVWEATVVPPLVDGGINYVVVDDYHFHCAGQAADRLDGFFSTEEDGRRLDVMPISETLRYKIPFAPVADIIGYLESMAPGGAAIYFDDIEKFGIWPETHDWVYGRRWLEDFIEAVGRSSRIQPMRYSEYHKTHRSRGVVYLPTVSYIEMSEWTLPAHSAERLVKLVGRAKNEGSYAQDKVYLRGGHWRNFLSRYPESNWMHKRMEYASKMFHSLPKSKQTASMRSDLHLAQANDAYWHGLFGGIYLPHLRRQVYAAIARLESAIDKHRKRPAIERIDLDFDGCAEVFLWRPQMIAVVKPSAGASLCELTHYGLNHNFADSFARREERYHLAIRSRESSSTSSDEQGIASIHDRVAYRTSISAADLVPDNHPRCLFVDFWEPHGGDAAWLPYQELHTKASAAASFESRAAGLNVRKRLTVGRAGPTVQYDLSASEAVRGRFAVESNVAMPSCDGLGGAYRAGRTALGGFGQRFTRERTRDLTLRDSELPGSVRFQFSEPATVSVEPLETVSLSESGFEKIMQSATVRATWPVELCAGEKKRVIVRFVISQEGARLA